MTYRKPLDGQGLNYKSYADHRKELGLPGDYRQVRQMAKDGRISLNEHGYIDPEIADMEWEENVDTSKRRFDLKTESEKSARLRKIEAEARLMEIKVEEAEGRLVSRELVERELFELSRIVRDRVLNSSNRLTPLLMNQSDPKKIHSIISIELRSVLENIYEDFGKEKKEETDS